MIYEYFTISSLRTKRLYYAFQDISDNVIFMEHYNDSYFNNVICYNRSYYINSFTFECKSVYLKPTYMQWNSNLEKNIYMVLELPNNAYNRFALFFGFLDFVKMCHVCVFNWYVLILRAILFLMFLWDDKIYLNVISVHIDMSNAFDKIWHDGIIIKLNQNGMSGNFHIVLNGQ